MDYKQEQSIYCPQETNLIHKYTHRTQSERMQKISYANGKVKSSMNRNPNIGRK